MTDCFRNTRQILEPAFNVLYGSYADADRDVPSKAYGDITTLEHKGLLQRVNGRWEVGFATREGEPPRLSLASSRTREVDAIVARVCWLVAEQDVRPQDVLVLTAFKDRAGVIADALAKAELPGIAGIHNAAPQKDAEIGRHGVVYSYGNAHGLRILTPPTAPIIRSSLRHPQAKTT